MALPTQDRARVAAALIASLDEAEAPARCRRGGLAEEVVVLAEEHASQLGRAVELLRVREPRAAVVLRRDDVDSSQPERDGHGPWDVNVHVEADGRPTAGAAYEIALPSGRTRSGALDANGRARVDVVGERGSARVVIAGLLADHSIEPKGAQK